MSWSTAHWAFLVLGIALMVGSFATVLRPLWRRRGVAVAVIASLSLATAALYQLVGTPQALERSALEQPTTIEGAIALLERQLETQPDRDGFALLANAYARSGQAEKVRDTWERALALAPEEPNVLVATAESRLNAASGRFDSRTIGLLEQALRRDPTHQRARFFLGLGHRQQGRPKDAAETWAPLLQQLPDEESATLRAEIAAARAEAGLPALAEAPSAATGGNAGSGNAAQGSDKPATGSLVVEVGLDPAFAARVRLRPDATVFVIARAPDGPPMPVAVERHRAGDLPLTVTLDDADGPMPTARLSTLKQVDVIGRLSESGNAMRQDGDIESAPVRVALPASEPVRVVIGAN